MNAPVYAEDITLGVRHALGRYTLTDDEVAEFSARWDPRGVPARQAAAAGYGGPIASGLLSLAVLQRLAADGVFRDWAILAARGIRDVRFHAPVRAGMALDGSLVVDHVEFRDGGRALVTVSKQLACDGLVVLSAVDEFYVLRRTAPPV